MKNSLRRSIFLGMLFSIAFLAACKKEDCKVAPTSSPLKASQQVEGSGISLENGYLYFRTLADYERTFERIKHSSEDEKDAFESSFNFKSLRKVYNEHAKADDLFFVNLERSGYPAENPERIEHCPEIMRNMFLYDKYPVDASHPVDSGYVLIRHTSNQYSSLINEKRLMRIGDTLVYCSRDTVKLMSPANYDRIKTLISAKVDGNGVKIQHRIHKSKEVKINSAAPCVLPPYYNRSLWTRTAKGEVTFSKKGRLCLGIDIIFTADKAPQFGCDAYYKGEFSGSIYSQRRNMFGCWVGDQSTVTLELYYNTTLVAPGMPAKGLIYTGNCNNYLTINDSNFSQGVSFPLIRGDDYPVMLNVTNFHARATRSGGSNGAEVNVYY